MRNISKFCFSKTYLYILLITVFITTYLSFSKSTVKQKNSIQSKAAPPAIIGGQDVKLGEFPSVVLIEMVFTDGYSFKRGECTGTLISPRWVLTAAHCVKELNFEIWDLKVKFGHVDFKKFNDNSVVNGIPVSNPDYFTRGFDIALIYLDKEIKLKKFPIIPGKNIENSDLKNIYKKNNLLTAVGWGCTKIIPPPTLNPVEIENLWQLCPQYTNVDDCNAVGRTTGGACGYKTICNACIPWGVSSIDYTSSEQNCALIKKKIAESNKITPKPSEFPRYGESTKIFNDILQKVNLPIVTDFEKLDGFYPNDFQIGYSDTPINYSICSGDSGGPSFFDYKSKEYLVGVNHAFFVDRYGVPNGPSLSADVYFFSEWINETLKMDPKLIKMPNVTIFPTPTVKIAQFVSDASYDKDWRTCLKYTSIEDCNKYGKPLCGYQGFCDKCIPWNREDIDYNDCVNINRKAEVILSSVPSTPTPIPQSIPLCNAYKKNGKCKENSQCEGSTYCYSSNCYVNYNPYICMKCVNGNWDYYNKYPIDYCQNQKIKYK